MYFIKNPESRVKNLNKLIKNSYIQYSTSVILQRSIPNIKDGLKPVQRRIVYAMFKEKMFNNRSFEKSAGVVGEVLKNYHPHGDSSVYDSLVRLSQY
jgi:DNA gyrase subunit A